MQLETDKCVWCAGEISRTSPNLPWVDDAELIRCYNHPVYEGIHNTVAEVREIVKRDYLAKVAMRKHEPLRAVDSNVVNVPRKPQRTTFAAAQGILPKSGTIRRLVYNLIRDNNGMTDFEIEDKLKMKHQTLSASRRSLVLDNYLIDSGMTRKNATGNECIVWVTTSRDNLFS